MRIALLIALLAGCLEPKSQICGDKVCAPEARCDEPTSTCIPAGCGDGIVNNNEQCDGSNLGTVQDCRSLGFYNRAPVTCKISCELDVGLCAESCGDHLIDGPELCDGEPPPGQSCLDFGFGVGRIGCENGCTPSFDSCSAVGLELQEGFDHSLFAINGRASDDVFAIGGGGTIVHFDGHRWLPVTNAGGQPVTFTGAFVALWPDPAGASVIVVGNDGNGQGSVTRFDGTTWTEISIPGSRRINAVWGNRADDVWAGGEAPDPITPALTVGVVIHFDGTTWSSPVTIPDPLTGKSLGAINGMAGDPSRDRFVAVGDDQTTATFDNGSWLGAKNRCSGCPAGHNFQALLAIEGGTELEYIAPGNAGLVAHSLDGGLTWTPLVQTQSQTALLTISGVRGDVYLGGTVGVLLRYDGTAFHRVTTEIGSQISGVWRNTADDIRVTLNAGEVRIVRGAIWYDVNSIAGITVRLQAADTLNGVTLVAGDDTTLLTSADGVKWDPVVGAGLPAGRDMSGLWFAPTGETFLSFTNPGLFERVPPGSTFTQFTTIPFDVTRVLTSVFGLSATDVYSTGHSGNIFHGTGAPLVWTRVTPVDATIDLNHVWGSSPTDVYVVGDQGTLLHSTDGQAWTPIVVADVTTNLNSIWGSGPDDIFVVGTGGTISHFDGVSWRLQHAGNHHDLEGVFGIAVPGHRASDVFALGPDSLLHYDGVAWSPMELPVIFGAFAATVRATATRNDVVFVGTNGNVATLARPVVPVETRCNDGWDDDRDGLVDCADPDCATSDECTIAGGSCRIAGALACGIEVSATTFTGVARLDTLPMVADLTDGPEAVYRFEAPLLGGTIELTFDTSQSLDLVVTHTYAGTKACNLDAPVAALAGPGTLSFTADPGESYIVIVDEPRGAAGEFTLSATCP